ncbi:MAG: LexA family transcriptional regulator [Paludibacter sp.]|nr:LexA family transcriptional regulator [Paludibacter sp.]
MSIANCYIYFCWLFANLITDSYILNMMKIREFCEVLKEIRGNNAQGEMARILGITQAYYSELERGKKTPSMTMLRSFSEKINKPLSYLMGEIEISEELEQKAKPIIEEKSNVRLGTKFLEIPLLTMATAASCGAGNGLYGVTPESTENIFVEASTFKCLDETRKPFGVPIEGDSMVGAGLEEGADAVINPAEEVMNGDAALISCDGSWMIKWVIFCPDGSVELRPANPNYSPTRIEAAYAADPSWFRIIGKVVATVKKGFPKRAF